MEQGHKAKVLKQAGAWDLAAAVAVGVGVLPQARAETVFVQTVGKEPLIN